MNGVFNDKGLAGMLEDADIKKRDMISPFIGVLLDGLCGESESCRVTKVLTEYVGVLNKVCVNKGQDKWTVSYIKEKLRDRKQFKVNGFALFSAYQNQKWEQ